MTKRLFIFAGYNAKNRVDAALVYYVRALAKFGDVALYMDSDVPKSELKKLSPYVIYADATRHGEYDFGSYKRAYVWARDNLDLNKYDVMYLVNDSVFGPTIDMTDTFAKMESITTPAFGLVGNPNPHHPHIQSWFVGLRPAIFTTKWFDEFMMSVKKLRDKGSVAGMYEHGLSNLIVAHGMDWQCPYSVLRRGVYNHVKKLFRANMPFIKKMAFTRHNGALGRQLDYIMRHIDAPAHDAIISAASDAWGAEYINHLLTRNPFRIMWRTVTYIIPKILTGKI